MYIFKITGDEILFDDGSKLEFYGSSGYVDFNRLVKFLEGFRTKALTFVYNQRKGYLVQYDADPKFKFDDIDISGFAGNNFMQITFKNVTFDKVTHDRCTYLEAYSETKALGPHEMTCRYIDKTGKPRKSVSFLAS